MIANTEHLVQMECMHYKAEAFESFKFPLVIASTVIKKSIIKRT